MGWEKRRQQTYYYRKVRVGRQVKSIYVGTEDAASEAVDRDLQRRKAKKAEQEAFQRAKTEIENRVQQVDAVCDQIELWIRASLLDAGLYRNVNSQWRHRRVRKTKM